MLFHLLELNAGTTSGTMYQKGAHDLHDHCSCRDGWGSVVTPACWTHLSVLQYLNRTGAAKEVAAFRHDGPVNYALTPFALQV